MIPPLMQQLIKTFYAIRQALFAGLLLFIILAFYNRLSPYLIFNAIALTSIVATLCLLFLSPPTQMSQPKIVLGGYVIALVVGLSCYFLYHWLTNHPIFIPSAYYSISCSALTVALCILFMSIFEAPHPPAAAFALGLMIDNWNALVVLVTLLIIVCLTLLKYFLDFKPLTQ